MDWVLWCGRVFWIKKSWNIKTGDVFDFHNFPFNLMILSPLPARPFKESEPDFPSSLRKWSWHWLKAYEMAEPLSDFGGVRAIAELPALGFVQPPEIRGCTVKSWREKFCLPDIFSSGSIGDIGFFGKIPFPFEMLLFNILDLWTQTSNSKDSFNIKALIRSWRGGKGHWWDVLMLNGTACSKQRSRRHRALMTKCRYVTHDGLWQPCAREAGKVVRLKRRQFWFM